LQVLLDVLWGDGWFVASKHCAIAADEELGEVPHHLWRAIFFWLLRCQEPVQVACGVAVDFNFGEQRERHAIVSCGEFQNLFVGAGFLRAELVAGETENGETRLSGGVMKRTQTCVLRGKPSTAGDVYHQTHCVCEALERDLLAGDGCHG
jgi:hypothetical protein